MADFDNDWNSSPISFDISNHGIPIPRNSAIPSFTRSDLDFNMPINDLESPPCRPPLVPPNSLVTGLGNNLNYPMQFELNFDHPRHSFSPLDAISPPLDHPGMNDIEDMEIKIEPLENLVDFTEIINTPTDPIYQEDDLLDNVNFEDLLMIDDMESSTTCLDPQHSSPAAMTTVHPDEVFGINRLASRSFQQNLSPSISVPGRDCFSLGALGASSLPGHSNGWKGNAGFKLSVANPNVFLQQQQSSHKHFGSDAQNRISVTGFNLPSSIKLEENPITSDAHHFAINEETTNSALHNLLITSPSSISSSSPKILSPKNPLNSLIAEEITVGQSVPDGSSFLRFEPQAAPSRLCSSAPVNDFSLEQFWQRRPEPRTHLLSTGSLAEEIGGSTSSLSTGGGLLSPIPHDLSIDEELDSDDDSDAEHYDSDSDDNDSIMNDDATVLSNSGKKERHFWQYNVQAKGPKGQRVNIIQNETNPHRLTKIMDPVFSPLCSVQGIKHSGKARRGDGNDLTPSPRKLVSIGTELDKLNQKINDMTPVSELHSTVRSKSRKEKNKLASRACRLKKKAQHEANKIKLYGLDREHQSLLAMIKKVRDDLISKVELNLSGGEDVSCVVLSLNESQVQHQQELTTIIEKAAKVQKDHRIAGNTTEFINRVIENCRGGQPTGGLEELTRTFTSARISSPDIQANDSEMLFS